MRSFAFETWDGGRLTVNRDFADVLRAAGAIDFASLMDRAGGTVTKNLLRERTTTRLELAGRGFYMKRHTPPPWKEYVKPLLRFRRPILGARPEWEAILHFHQAGIPTMTPVALGDERGRSFLLTEAIEGCRKLSQWTDELVARNAGCLDAPRSAIEGQEAGVRGQESGVKVQESAVRSQGSGVRSQGLDSQLSTLNSQHEDHSPLTTHHSPDSSLIPHPSSSVLAVVDDLAGLTRRMHAAGLHHQDYYLTHLLVRADDPAAGVRVIDLGRARKRTRLGRRWIVKDLAQLNYSARSLPVALRRRFLERYLGRPLQRGDRPFVVRIERKTARIERHSIRHGL